MTHAYDSRLIGLADEIAREKDIRLMHGVYVGVTGPTFETPSEYNYYSIIGGDAVGMSTVSRGHSSQPCGMRVFGISVITDLGGKYVTQSADPRRGTAGRSDRTAQMPRDNERARQPG